MPAQLKKLLEALEEIAPLELAEEWDNVGLLLCPSRKRTFRKILLTIDLTEPVLEEAEIERFLGLVQRLPELTADEVRQLSIVAKLGVLATAPAPKGLF